PEKRITFRALRERLLPRPLPIAFAGGDDAVRERMMAELQSEFPQADCQEWSATPPDAALTLWLGLPSASQTLETDWEALPPFWRLDLTRSHEPLLQAARSALQAALGATAPESASR